MSNDKQEAKKNFEGLINQKVNSMKDNSNSNTTQPENPLQKYLQMHQEAQKKTQEAAKKVQSEPNSSPARAPASTSSNATQSQTQSQSSEEYKTGVSNIISNLKIAVALLQVNQISDFNTQGFVLAIKKLVQSIEALGRPELIEAADKLTARTISFVKMIALSEQEASLEEFQQKSVALQQTFSGIFAVLKLVME